jgi:hypothetical protein
MHPAVKDLIDTIVSSNSFLHDVTQHLPREGLYIVGVPRPCGRGQHVVSFITIQEAKQSFPSIYALHLCPEIQSVDYQTTIVVYAEISASAARESINRAGKPCQWGVAFIPKQQCEVAYHTTTPPLQTRKPRLMCSAKLCEKDPSKGSVCSECRSVRYCSKECQRADWKIRHKKLCKTLSKNHVEFMKATSKIVS